MSIIGIILVLILTYYSTKWISTKTSLTAKSKYMSIVDKMVLGQNRFIAIAEIYKKYYLISITEKDINILKELEDFSPIGHDPVESSLNFNRILDKYKNQVNIGNNDEKI